MQVLDPLTICKLNSIQQYTEGHDNLQAGQDSQQYIEEQDGSPQAEQQHSHRAEQDNCNSIVGAYERPESQVAVHPFTLNSMEDLLFPYYGMCVLLFFCHNIYELKY